MDHSLENRIRERAYEIWAAHGYVHGQADQHWLAAEREILAASTAALARQSAPQKVRRSPARSKAATLRGPAKRRTCATGQNAGPGPEDRFARGSRGNGAASRTAEDAS